MNYTICDHGYFDNEDCPSCPPKKPLAGVWIRRPSPPKVGRPEDHPRPFGYESDEK